MIETLGNILTISSDICVVFLNLIINTLSFSFNVSYIVGQLIVKFVVGVVSLVVSCVLGLQTLLQVLAEDSFVFLSDLGTTLSFLYQGILVVSDAFIHAILGASSALGHGVKAVQNTAVYISLGLVDLVFSILYSIHHCLLLIKNSLVLVGLTSWDLFTFLPNLLMDVKRELVSVVIHCMASLRDVVNSLRLWIHCGIQGLLLFVSDIPSESLYGLLVCFTIVFLSIKYHHSIRPLIVRNIVYFLTQGQKTLITAWTYLEAFTFWLLTNQMTPSPNGPRRFGIERTYHVDQLGGAHSNEDVPQRDETADNLAELIERKAHQEPEERLCVVCQDNEKCTIILPCRHVCLCYECCATIKRTHGRCPICRHVVRRTMRVYI